MLATPIAANRTSCRVSPGGTPGRTRVERRTAQLLPQRRDRQPPGGQRPATRSTPRRSASAVATMSTRLSGSSTQSTGTSWMRSPDRSARTSSSVSKNQPSSSTSGSSPAATSARIALNPHCASENRAASVAAQQQVVAAGDDLALGPADDPGRRGAAGCRSPGRSARTAAARPAAASAARSVDRSTSMYASTGASEADQTARSARPRPFSARCTTATAGSSAAIRRATASVPSVDALSATVIRNRYGNSAARCACSRRRHDSRPASSLWTGTTTSSAGTEAGGTARGRASAAGRGTARGAVVVVMPATISAHPVAGW